MRYTQRILPTVESRIGRSVPQNLRYSADYSGPSDHACIDSEITHRTRGISHGLTMKRRDGQTTIL